MKELIKIKEVRREISESMNLINETLFRIERKVDTIATTTEKEFLSPYEAAGLLRVTKHYIYRMTAQRRIPHYKQGKLLYFKRSELEGWIVSSPVKTRNKIMF